MTSYNDIKTEKNPVRDNPNIDSGIGSYWKKSPNWDTN
jgi:hypothetical protein